MQNNKQIITITSQNRFIDQILRGARNHSKSTGDKFTLRNIVKYIKK